MNTQKIKSAVKKVAQKGQDKRAKSNKTLSLDFENFEVLSGHCRDSGVKISNLVDDLIEAYLEEMGLVK